MKYPLPYTPEQSRYAQCRAAARRARIMLYRGAEPLGVPKSRKPERIAVDEVRSGAVPFKIIRPGGRPVLVPAPITVRDQALDSDIAA